MSVQTIYAVGNWVNQDNATVLPGRLVGGSQFIPTPIPPGAGGAVSNLRIRRTTAPAAATSHTITVRKSGVDTAVTATIAAGANYAEDITHSVALADTDTISIFTTKVGAPGSSDYQVAFDYTPTTPNLSIYGWGNGRNPTLEFHAALYGADGAAAEEAYAASELPVGGVISSQAVLLKTAPGVGTSRIFTIRLNGVDQDGSGGTPDTRVTITGAATSGSASFTLPVVAGDLVTIRQTVSGVPASTTFIQGALAFTPTAGTEAVATAQVTTVPTGSVSYIYPIGGSDGTAPATPESTFYAIGGVTTQYLTTMYLSLLGAPGAGKSWTCTLRKNGASAGLSVTISGATDTRGHSNISGGALITIDRTVPDLWDLEFTPSGTPPTTSRPCRVALGLSSVPPVPELSWLPHAPDLLPRLDVPTATQQAVAFAPGPAGELGMGWWSQSPDPPRRAALAAAHHPFTEVRSPILNPVIVPEGSWTAGYPDQVPGPRYPIALRTFVVDPYAPAFPEPPRAWHSEYPDWLDRRTVSPACVPFLVAPIEPVPDVVVPELAWHPTYPDWIDRPALPADAQLAFTQNLPPLADPALVPLAWQAHYPDLVWQPPRTPLEGAAAAPPGEQVTVSSLGWLPDYPVWIPARLWIPPLLYRPEPPPDPIELANAIDCVVLTHEAVTQPQLLRATVTQPVILGDPDEDDTGPSVEVC